MKPGPKQGVPRESAPNTILQGLNIEQFPLQPGFVGQGFPRSETSKQASKQANKQASTHPHIHTPTPTALHLYTYTSTHPLPPPPSVRRLPHRRQVEAARACSAAKRHLRAGQLFEEASAPHRGRKSPVPVASRVLFGWLSYNIGGRSLVWMGFIPFGRAIYFSKRPPMFVAFCQGMLGLSPLANKWFFRH